MDMTRGPVLAQMAKFALPVLFGMLCQRIYNFADTYIVGRFLGDEALAAVSIAGTAMYMLFSIMMGVTTGVSVVISQYYGAQQEDQIRHTFVAGSDDGSDYGGRNADGESAASHPSDFGGAASGGRGVPYGHLCRELRDDAV